MAPRETKNNAYAKFWGDKHRALWYETVCYGIFCSDQFQDGGDITLLLYLC